jgi:hypothetical protein
VASTNALKRFAISIYMNYIPQKSNLFMNGTMVKNEQQKEKGVQIYLKAQLKVSSIEHAALSFSQILTMSRFESFGSLTSSDNPALRPLK